MTSRTIGSSEGATSGGAERWYALSPDEVAQKLAVDPATGVSAAKAAELLKTNGPNALPAEKPPPGWRLFLAQYKSYMQIILVAAAVASIVIGQIATGVAVLLITALNALGGLRQQGKAESAMNALQSMLKTTARVRRDGSEVKVGADQVVLGDVVLLTAGDDVCADGRLVEATSLQIDESALTGESVPASKSAEVVTDEDPVLGDQSNMAFMNTPVTHGSGVMIVTGTGADTAVGKISGMLKSAPNLKTPLTKQLDTLTLWIAAAAGLTIAIMFAVGISRGQSAAAIFTTAIALALAAVPMAMPTVLQVILSGGSRDLAAHGAVVKSLDSVETLGSTSAINSDKTGTLTMNQVTVVEVIDPTDRYAISGMGYGLDGEVEHTAGNTNTIEAAVLPFLITNDAKLVNGKVVGDPTEGALLVLGHKAKLDIEGTQQAYPRLATLPFDPTYKLMAAFCDAKDASGKPVIRVFVKGAAPAVIGRSTSALANGATVPWGDELNQRAGEQMDRLGKQGLRIMAAAMKDIDPDGFDPAGDLLSLVQGLQMTALVGMIDPPRLESLDAVRAAQDANIRVRMVTGDDVVTGAAVAKQLGIPGEAILGTELAAMSEADRLARIDNIGVVGRVAPEHKVLMVQTLLKQGDVVAMTGDGVNDAPAIKAADIGIAMGSGTQVAKNAGRMILTDDNFATIVRAVSEGRKLYDNMLKYIRFMLVALVTYVVTFLLATLFNIAGGQPFSAVQILWINFMITAPVGIALGLDKETPGLMKRQPRPRAASIMSPAVITTVGLVGLFMSLAIDALIVAGTNVTGKAEIASTMGLVAFSLMLVVAAFETRDEKASILRVETFDNKTLNITALVEIALALLIARGGVLTSLLGTAALSSRQWLLGALPALVLFIIWELGQADHRSPGWQAYVPGLAVVRSYRRAWLSKDIVAGLVLSALLVPQGMAYAELAGLPAVTGLYTSILCLLGYAIFGPSRVLVLGPDSALGSMIAATILPLVMAGGDPARAVALASLLAVLVGVLMTVAGLARFGFVADLLSKPTQIGYMNGLAVTIVIGQLPKLFGFSVDADGLLAKAKGFAVGVVNGDANATAAAIGIVSLIGILLLNRLLPKLPSVLIVVILSALAVNLLDLESKGVDTIGVLPQGFPPFTLPLVSLSDVPPLLIGAFAIAVVALADTMSTASSFAARRGEQVRGNQEMIGIGAANIFAGLFQGFPVSTSGSRTAVAEQAGARSQLTGLVGAVVIAVVLVFATGLMQYVPQPVLGAIVIAAAISLADVAGTRLLWRRRRTEFWLSIAALLGVALLGVLPGILLAVGLSVLNVFRHTWWPHQAELGRIAGISGLHDTKSYPDAELLPGLLVYRFDAPLIFANARTFDEAVRAYVERRPDLRSIILAAEPVTDIDITASDMLEALDLWLNERGVSLVFAELKDPVREKIERYELTHIIDPAHFFPTLDDAVADYRRQTGEAWHEPTVGP